MHFPPSRPWKRHIWRKTGLALLGVVLLAAHGGTPTACRGIWICPEETRHLPMKGAAWKALKKQADRPTPAPRLDDRNDDTDVRVMAKALVYARTGRRTYRDQVIATTMAAIGTEKRGATLALGRNLVGYVIAADIVGLPPRHDARFRSWLRRVVDTRLSDGRTLKQTHEKRPNNWGTHAGASRLAVALYLQDHREVERVATVFHGWLGNRSAYSGFHFGALDWQADPWFPVGINPKGARRNGHSIDGVLPDDQRRCCDGFTWPPPKENYAYEALQGALAQAEMLHRAGYDVWEWEDRALLRAFRWLNEVARYPAEGDDTWQPYLINHHYATRFPTVTPSDPGKNVGYTDWTHGPGSRKAAIPQEARHHRSDRGEQARLAGSPARHDE